MAEQSGPKKLSLIGLVMMIFTSVFGFTNITRAFYLMGYSSIIWYIIAACTFFIPYAFMMSEFGSAFKDEQGGIYVWMSKSVGPKYAFMGTFMWYASYIIWMVSISTGIMIPMSSLIFGMDRTQELSFFGLNSVQCLGVIAIIWVIVFTFISSRGISKISKITSIGGIAVLLINLMLFLVGIIVLIANGHMAEPITVSAFFHSPNPDYQSMIQIFSFLVFAVFAYGGLEAIGGLVNETDNPTKNFPKGILLAAGVISIGYALGIFITGAMVNWDHFVYEGGVEITLGNQAYQMLHEMGRELALSLGLSSNTADIFGSIASRYMGLSIVLSIVGAYMTLSFSPLKQLIEGTPKEVWPKSWSVTKNGMPINAMKVQAAIVIVIVALVSFGGDSAKAFFKILTGMTNVAMTLPYMFLAFAFLKFKMNDSIEKPYVIYGNKNIATVFVGIVIAVVGFANIFTIIQPAIDGDPMQTVWSIAGPIFFSLAAYTLYNRYEKNHLK